MAGSIWRWMAKTAVRLYPRAWRDRYADEMLALLDTTLATAGVFVDVIGGALRERGFGRAASPTVRVIVAILRGWVLMNLIAAAVITVLVLMYAPAGSERRTLAGLIDAVSITWTSIWGYFLPSLVLSLPVLATLLLLRAERWPWLGRAVFIGAFMIFSAWWDAFMLRHAGWRAVELEHLAVLLAGWLIAARIFPRVPHAPATPFSEAIADSDDSEPPSSPRALLRVHTIVVP